MKTRIIYPDMWSNDEVVELSKEAKVLLFNLLTSPLLGLSRYLKLGDNRAKFETGLKQNDLEKAQTELLICGIKYYDGWYYLGCDYAYLDYEGRDRVEEAKKKEISQIPEDVIEYFNGLTTSSQLVLNHKSKTINHKSKIDISNNLVLSTVELKELQEKFPRKTVKDEYEKAQNYLGYTNKKYKDTKKFFINWLHNSKDTRVPPPKMWTPPTEVNHDNLDLINGFKEDLYGL